MPSYPPRKFERRLVAQSTMRTNAFVIIPPSFCHGPCFIERQEPVLVQTLVAKPTIERLNERIIRWLSWPAEVELHAARVRPQIPKLLEMNSGPLSTRIVCGLPRCEDTPSKTRTTSSPVNR